MKLKYQFVLTDLGDEVDAVPVGEGASRFRGMLRLNKSSAEIFEMLTEETEPQKIHDELCRRYPDEDRDEIGKKLEVFLNTLIKEGVLTAL